MKRLMDSARYLGGACALLLTAGCGDRPAAWDASFRPGTDEAGNKQVAGLTG